MTENTVPEKDRLVAKYETHYVELYDVTVFNMISNGLNPQLLEKRRVAGLVKHEDGKWIAILKYDITKDLGESL